MRSPEAAQLRSAASDAASRLRGGSAAGEVAGSGPVGRGRPDGALGGYAWWDWWDRGHGVGQERRVGRAGQWGSRAGWAAGALGGED